MIPLETHLHKTLQYHFQRQLEFFYTYFKFDYDPYGYVDYDDKFISPKEAGMSNTPHIDRFGVLLDDTDSRLDPRIGYSIQLERWEWPSRIGIDPEFYQYDLDISGYFPIQEQKLVLVANQFFSTKNYMVEFLKLDMIKQPLFHIIFLNTI